MVSRSPRGETQRSAAGQATGTSAPRQSPLTRAAILASAFLLPALTLTACAAPTHYAGIDLRAGAANAEVQALAQQAQGGSKEAQLALGIRYEEGRGVPIDPKKAQKLYRTAATASGGTTYVYVPATRKGGKGGVMPVSTGPSVAGLGEASGRLDQLRGFERHNFPTKSSQALPLTQEDADAALIELMLQYGYQSIFNGLKYPIGTWQKRITSEDGAWLISRDIVETTLALVIEPNYDVRHPRQPTKDQISSRCLDSMNVAGHLTSSQLRLYSTCLVYDCESRLITVLPRILQKLEEVQRTLQRESDLSPDRLHDIIFLSRASAICGMHNPALKLYDLTRATFENLRNINSACLSSRCNEAQRRRILAARGATANALIAAYDIRPLPSQYVSDAAEIWGSQRIGNDETYDANLETFNMLCRVAKINQAECAKRFPYTRALEQRLIGHVVKNRSAKYVDIVGFEKRNETELSHRLNYNSSSEKHGVSHGR